jgi:hypothetical protein
MNRSHALLSILVITTSCLAPRTEAEELPETHARCSDGVGGAHRTEVSAAVGERVVIVSDNGHAEVEMTVRRLPPDKKAIIYVEVQPKQSANTGTVPMGLPLDRWFRLVNVNSGQCLTVKDRSIDAEARLVQDNPDAADRGLLWRLIPVAEGWYALQNRTSEQVASLPDDRKDAGANLVQVPLDRGCADQQWRPLWLEGNRFVVVNRRSGQALAVAYGATHAGATICQWPLNISWRQHQWHIEVVDTK